MWGQAIAALWRALVAPGLMLLASVGAAGAQAAPQRIVAVGDLHGDYAAWMAIAHTAGLIGPGGHWSGGRTTLVQMGDITDREPDSLKIVRSLQQLQREAPRQGGRVVVVLGNHEAMNLVGDNRYTTAGEYAAMADGQSAERRDKVYELNRTAIEAAARAKDPKATPEAIRQAWNAEHPLGWVEHRIGWGPTGELGQWATRNAAVVKIDGTLFVHGGLSAEYAKVPLDELNRRVADAMAKGDDSSGSILYDPLGPLWYRGLAGRDADADGERAEAARGRPVAAPPPAPAPALTIDQEVTAVLAAYGAQRMVIAHTPILSGIAITSGGRLARIDTGISRYYGGKLSWLEIVGGTMTAHETGRPAS